MTENLKVSKYRNGDAIPTNLSSTDWQNTTSGAYAIYNNTTYGKLYNWHAVADPRGLCPTGWHVPSYAEWTTIENFLGGSSVAGGKMKSTGTIEAGTGLWYSPNTNATNSSGFMGLAGGRFEGFDGVFSDAGFLGQLWSTTHYMTSAQSFSFGFDYFSGFSSWYNDDVQRGLSVRCLKD